MAILEDYSPYKPVPGPRPDDKEFVQMLASFVPMLETLKLVRTMTAEACYQLCSDNGTKERIRLAFGLIVNPGKDKIEDAKDKMNT